MTLASAASYLLNYQPVVDTDPDEIVTIDFETYYDSQLGYSLRHKSVTMESYIRSPLFLVHGVGIKKGMRPARWVHGDAGVRRLFDKLDLSYATCLAQNAPFDALILNEVFHVKPKAWLDTQPIAAMLLGNTFGSVSLEKLTEAFLPGQYKDQAALHAVQGKRKLTLAEYHALGVYCIGDCEKTYALYRMWHRQLTHSPHNADLISLVTRMFSEPMLMLNGQVLDALIASEAIEKQRALDNSVASSAKQIRSNPQFATLLRSMGVEPPIKISITTGKETFAFSKKDREFKELLRHPDPDVRQLVQARLRIKTSINETRAASYKAVSTRGPWPVHLLVSGARTTHRLAGAAGGGGNPQNLGKKSPLRQAIEPPKGFRMFAIDSKNVELRTAMALAGEKDVVTRLRDPEFDLYPVFSSVIYQCEVEQIDADARNVGKVACLQLQYGSGAFKFRDTAWGWGIDLSEEEALRITALYRSSFPRIKAAWNLFDRVVTQLARGQEECTWRDALVQARVDGPGGHPCLYMPETGLSITYPNLGYQYDEVKQKRSLYYDTFDKKTRRKKRAPLYGAKAFQQSCQALARNVVLEQTLALDNFLRTEIHPLCRTVGSVHDEGIHLVPVHADCDAAIAGAIEIYGTSPVWWPDLPTFGEAAWGDNYAACK